MSKKRKAKSDPRQAWRKTVAAFLGGRVILGEGRGAVKTAAVSWLVCVWGQNTGPLFLFDPPFL